MKTLEGQFNNPIEHFRYEERLKKAIDNIQEDLDSDLHPDIFTDEFYLKRVDLKTVLEAAWRYSELIK